MDAELVTFLFAGSVALFAILAFAKDRDGKRYGTKRMAQLWLASLPYFLSAFCEFTIKHADGSSEEVKITYSTWFLLVLPLQMIRENIARRKKPNKAPEPTSGTVTPPAEPGVAPVPPVAHL